MKQKHLAAPVLVLAASLVACGAPATQAPLPQPPQAYELPPGSEIAPVLSPQQALETFRLPAGFRIELVAAEPLVHDPVAIEWDTEGRLWVVEMTGYMPNLLDEGADAPIGRIAVLEDLNGDGRMNRRTVFMDSLVLPRAIKVLEQGVLIAAPPYLWLARDTNGDLRADTREVVRSDYGDPEANVEHTANGLLWGMDNWIHNANWPGQLRLRDGGFDFRRTPSLGQWGIAMDEYGRIYRNTNEDPLRADLIPSHYAARNPNLPSVRGVYERLTPNVPVYPARPTPAINRGYRPQTMRPDSTLAHYTAAGAPVPFTGDRLPAELRRQVFVMEPVGNLVGRFEVSQTPNGMLAARRIDENTDFLTSLDERFRPVNFANGPDGAFYVVDMYRGIIQHRFFITGYLEQQIIARGLEAPTGLGRIYRIVHESTPPRREAPRLSGMRSAQLVPLLAHANGWHRITAQQLLVERGDAAVAPAVRQILRSAADDRARLHALWTLEGLGQIDLTTMEAALADASPHVRAAAVRISEAWLPAAGSPVTTAVLRLMDDPSPIVRWQLAASLGELPIAEREPALARIVARYGNDPMIPDLVVSGLAGREVQFLERLLNAPAAEVTEQTGTGTLRVLASAILRGRDPTSAQRLVQWATEEARPRWQRVALLSPAPTPPGGPQGIQLASAPQGLIAAMESAENDVRTAARGVANVLNWPGKPQPVSELPPLNAEQQEFFAAGERQYMTICVACHGPAGEGIPGAAKPLAGSPWVVTRPVEVIRIVMHGKEGEMLMPPLGHVMSDEALAAVLTYIRRSWGNEASAISTAQVAEIRGATLGRDRPYTEEELRAAR